MQELVFVALSVAELGLEAGACLPEIYEAAEERGFQLCPLEAGPYLRLALMDQADSANLALSAGTSPDGALTVASAPVGDHSFPKGFYLRVVDGIPWLRGYRCDDAYRFVAQDQFIFLQS